MDELLGSISDAIVLPFGASDNNVASVAEDMAKYPKAWAWPSNWPSNSKAAEIDQGYIDNLEELYPDRILKPLPATHSIRDLILQNFDGTLLPPAQKYCRTLARQILDLIAN